MNARDARIRIQHRQRLLREHGAAGSGHTYGYDLSVFCGHFVRVKLVSQRVPAMSTERVRSATPRISTSLLGTNRSILPSVSNQLAVSILTINFGPAPGDSMNGNSQPLEVAMDFIKRINAGDINVLCEVMTENHIFQDALGKRFMGRETMRQGWTNYLKMVADYQVHADEFFHDRRTRRDFRNSERPIRRSARTRARKQGMARPAARSIARRRTAIVGPNGFWEVPAAWRADRAGWQDCRMARLCGQSTAAQIDGRRNAVIGD